MADERKVIWQGPINALLATDADFAAARKAVAHLAGILSEEQLADLVNVITAQRVDAREVSNKE